jgi:hypothetical protein
MEKNTGPYLLIGGDLTEGEKTVGQDITPKKA